MLFVRAFVVVVVVGVVSGSKWLNCDDWGPFISCSWHEMVQCMVLCCCSLLPQMSVNLELSGFSNSGDKETIKVIINFLW